MPGAGEVLVRVHAAGLNGADIHQWNGGYPAPPGAPQDILGMELAGEVLSAGEGATRFKPGDRVMGIVGGGAQAELAVVHERVLMPVPERLDWPQAGGVPEVFTTAHDALFTPGGPAGPASGCWCTAPLAGSVPRRCSSDEPQAHGCLATVRNPRAPGGRRGARRQRAGAGGVRRPGTVRCDPRARRRDESRRQPAGAGDRWAASP